MKNLILKAGSVAELLALQNKFLSSAGEGLRVIFKRYFLSFKSQKHQLPEENVPVSYIIQPPLDGSTIAVWLFMLEDTDVEFHFSASQTAAGADSAFQTSSILESYQKSLEESGMSFADNCVRTWFFVDDIDNNYAGLVKARKENFTGIGLTEATHYISSTGIAGKSPKEGSVVQMDALSLKGKFTQRYLYAPSHLNPTYEYGVTFERGVALDFEDGNRQIYISGTASIDNKGNVLHVGDVCAQAERMLENVQILLKEGGARWKDVQVIIVYLRNAQDYEKVSPIFSARFPDTPYIITHAPVCRPSWLIEMECIAEVL